MVLQLLFSCILCGCFIKASPLKSFGSEPKIIIDSGLKSNFYTKRVWLYVNNNDYKRENSKLVFEYKKDEFSSSIASAEMFLVQNYNNKNYYYADMPIGFFGFRISSVLNETIIAQTKWKYNFNPAQVHEIYSGSNTIRKRTSDVSNPDAIVIASVLSGYCSFDSSFENGFSAYSAINNNWVKHFAGNVNGNTFENVFLYDYEETDYINKKEDTKKTKLISVADKLSELYENYKKGGIQNNPANVKIKLIGLFLFVFVVLVSTVISWIALRFVPKHLKVKRENE